MKFKQEGENISNLDKLLKIKEESFNKRYLIQILM